MRIGFSFSGAARSFLDRLSATRKSLKSTASRLKCDASHAGSLGYFILGAVAFRLLNRERDDADARKSNLRGFAQRAVWLTHFLDDPEIIGAVKTDILAGNLDGITVQELDAFLSVNLDTLHFGMASPDQRADMIAGLRRQIRSEAVVHQSGPAL